MTNLHNISKKELKKAKLENIPEGWDVTRLGSITKSSQYGISQSPSSNGKVPMLRMNNIEDGKIDYSDVALVDLSEDEKEIFTLTRGDLLFNRTNSFALVGKTAIYEGDGQHTFASYLIRLAFDSERVDSKFVCYFFNYQNSKYLLQSMTTPGVSQYNINPTVLKKHFLIPLPTLLEQKEISLILSIWDKAIEAITSLIAAKTLLKKWFIQQLLTGNLRFKEFVKIKFHKIELGVFLIPTPRPVPRPNSPYTALGIRSHGKGTFLKAVENPEAVMMDTLYEVKEDDLIVNITFAWEGAIAIVKKSDEGSLVSHRFPTYTFNREIAIPEYFRHVIQTKRFVHELGLVSPGGAGRNRVMSKTDFLNIFVSIPSIAEQQKIAAVLNGIDKEIELLKKQLECLKTQKKGLMQKLLTGKIRVKV